ncbi:NYN domain-containing protein [Agrobacterium tumefaciens]|nr:NYN domain-containing protein [Agrobacterium tumefaciens]NTB19081.1 NYN domain-containing protein [Agrobacterium tumefaciens]QQE36932.1 NYN domain-containing protein [Agrobacterium tumefaciens]
MLTDGENLSSKIMEALFGVTATLGDASRRHIHHDRTQANMRGWKSRLVDHAVRPVQQFSNCAGKNATDGAMIINAMDLLHRKRLEGFGIALSDGDFTRLAVRIREETELVTGRHCLLSWAPAAALPVSTGCGSPETCDRSPAQQQMQT